MVQFNQRQKDEIEWQYRILKQPVLNDRQYGEDGYTRRNPFHRDYTRILYSSSFRRLQGKMQILGIEPTAFFRNRLTHSLEVAQIAKSIALTLRHVHGMNIYDEEDIFLLDAAALAHDIGHPAFGHKGERVLDDLAKNKGHRFEGNAQNFRVLRTLEKKDPTIKGLNLTNRTLLAINKYLVCEDKEVKKFMFKDDYDYLLEVRKKAHLLNTRTLDVQIIELADDIAYSVHDLEDGLAFHYFSIDELLYEIRLVDPSAYDLFVPFVEKSRKYALESCSYNTLQEYSQVFRKSLTSTLTHEFINDVTLSCISDRNVSKKNGIYVNAFELQLNTYKRLCKLLAETIFTCVSRFSNVAQYEAHGEIVLKTLYDIFTNDAFNGNGQLLPPDYRPHGGYTLEQGSIDYIAGMMDTFAISQYEDLKCLLDIRSEPKEKSNDKQMIKSSDKDE